MLTNTSLKVEIVKKNIKFHENLFRNILNSLIRKISKWPETLSESYRK